MNPVPALLDPHVYPISSGKLILKFHVASNSDLCSDGMNHVLNLFGLSIYIQGILSMIIDRHIARFVKFVCHDELLKGNSVKHKA